VINMAAGHQLKNGAYIEKLGLAAMTLNRAPCHIFTIDIHCDYLSKIAGNSERVHFRQFPHCAVNQIHAFQK
jgi:hypothetical protein